ncbi:hypothetical protein [Baaleninema sp.]|uniref:hypothetical protein n=1 Tax=Baaleninema sp. TaxID=3101197 RepID=UPI003D07073E
MRQHERREYVTFASRVWRGSVVAIALVLAGCTASVDSQPSDSGVSNVFLLEDSFENRRFDAEGERGFRERSLAVRRQLAQEDLAELDEWWRSRDIGDPHKYLLPPMLAQLSLTPPEQRTPIWDFWRNLERDAPDLYHFRSLYDVRIFFLFRDELPEDVRNAYQTMVSSPRVLEWGEGGTENHISQQYLSGLALMDASGFPVAKPHLLATNEAWLRSEVWKYFTIGQGEFHSSTYYGFTIGALLNLYDFAATPHLRTWAKAGLDWLATNMALRLSWGTAGGAESRGFDRGTWYDSGIGAVAWMWWGSDEPQEIDRIASQMSDKHSRLAILAATSSYRPPPELRAIALKRVPLPFQLRASHPAYYSYREDNQFWETFYATEDYTLGTLVTSGRSYQVRGTINAQYATYKLVVRDVEGRSNAVVSLGGTYHTPMATGRSPGDRKVQEKGTVLYQLRLNERDRQANVPDRTHLVVPREYGEPQRFGDWYVWRIENVWLCVRPWGDTVTVENPVVDGDENYLALVAQGTNTAWITDAARVTDYPTFDRLTEALGKTEISDENWVSDGEIGYTSLAGDRLEMRYAPDRPVAEATINGRDRDLGQVPVFESPYVNQDLESGVLTVRIPDSGLWKLRLTPSQPIWETSD